MPSDLNGTGFTIQQRTGVILFLFALVTATINFYSGVKSLDLIPIDAFLHIAVLPTLLGSLVLLPTCFINLDIFRYLQVSIIFAAGFTTTFLTEPGNISGSMIILLGFALLYQYGYLARRFILKTTLIFAVYIILIAGNIIFISKWSLPAGIPSILFTFSSFFLFWSVFHIEIKKYLVKTNQLNAELFQSKETNVKLSQIAMDRAVEIEKQNVILEHRLKEKEKLEERLRATIEQKEVLLREVHHRVKNNLTVMLSILNLQLDQDLTEEMRDFIHKNKNRIQAMATVHELNYQDDNYSTVELGYYLRNIVDDILVSYDLYLDISKSVEIEDCVVTLTTAISCGLILNECVTNSIKHVFLHQQGVKELVISGKHLPDNSYKLTISDNGNGTAGSSETTEPEPSFGIWLIKNVAEGQLNGSATCHQDNGTVWEITFPLLTNRENLH